MPILRALAVFLLVPSVLAFGDEKCPDHSDSTHRYITAPVFYDRPQAQSFQLYYELNKDFDPSLPTLFFFHDGQQPFGAVGDPDALKQKYGVKFNFLRMAHRGISCSPIEGIQKDGQINWKLAFDIFRSENVIEDMDLIRRDLLGDNGTMFVFGGSGGGILAAQYLAKHPEGVAKIYMERATADNGATDKWAKEFFFSNLQADNVYADFVNLISSKTVPLPELLWVLQRSGYDHPPSDHFQRDLILGLMNNDFTMYQKWSTQYQDISLIAPDWQQKMLPGIVRIFEFDPLVGTTSVQVPSVVDAIEPLIRPLTELEITGVISSGPINVLPTITGLETDTLLVAARWDHVLPYQSMQVMNKALPHSKLIILDDTHGMVRSEQCHIGLFKAFFENGKESPEFAHAMNSAQCHLWLQ